MIRKFLFVVLKIVQKKEIMLRIKSSMLFVGFKNYGLNLLYFFVKEW